MKNRINFGKFSSISRYLGNSKTWAISQLLSFVWPGNAGSAKSSSPTGKGAHSQLAERQQNSRLRHSNIAAVCPLALLFSLLPAAAPAETAPPAFPGQSIEHPVSRSSCQCDFTCGRVLQNFTADENLWMIITGQKEDVKLGGSYCATCI